MGDSDTSFEIPVGPQHPALKEPESFTFVVDGERVVGVKPRLGYNHRGVEKAMEARTFIQNLYLVERVCGICSHAHVFCYAQNVEEAAGIEAPPRAQYIRTIVAELERIHSHYLWVGIAAHVIGFDTLFMYTWRDREVVMDLLELISGNRVNYAMNTIGGVRRDIPTELAEEVKRGLRKLEERTKYYKGVCTSERSLLRRAVGVGILKTSDALNLSAVGPTLRASGITRDVRRDDPYGAYGEVPFNVVTHDGCDVASRVIVRLGELFESIDIIRYALEHLPEGPLSVRAPEVVAPNEAVSRVEAPRGEDIHYIRSNGTDKPDRYKIRAPTLANIPSVCRMLIGVYVADIPIVLAAIDPCFSCTDRMAFIDVGGDRRWTLSGEELRKYGIRWYEGRKYL
jgi:membrane-bound hydrogenase subunit alpha